MSFHTAGTASPRSLINNSGSDVRARPAREKLMCSNDQATALTESQSKTIAHISIMGIETRNVEKLLPVLDTVGFDFQVSPDTTFQLWTNHISHQSDLIAIVFWLAGGFFLNLGIRKV